MWCAISNLTALHGNASPEGCCHTQLTVWPTLQVLQMSEPDHAPNVPVLL